ncbi:POP1-domain-containing protein [Phellopilus nigrolimitatus]|nr:POP1-domain-containing protein [Phellopilus nigrolimitatus]
MSGLPSTIDVEKFAEARAFEIGAMKVAMDNASAGATHRAWQMLPRHLRRRAASHDVRRVPSRLRPKARAESSQIHVAWKMDAPAKATHKKKLPKRGKGKIVKRTEELLRRQVDKTWLETHIWHAKRMKMENMWNYRLAVTPTEKSFRPSHRASVHGCILHDASYEAVIELKGSEASLKEVITACCDPQTAGPSAVRSFTNGARVCYSHLYKPKSYPFNLIGPVEILWKPAVSVDNTLPGDAQTSNEKQKSSKVKAKQRKSLPKEASYRSLWVRCHPLIYDDVLSSIKYSLQAYLQRAQSTSNKEVEIEVADLRDQFNIFELVGPKSSQVIHGALTIANDENRDAFKHFWSALGQLQTAGSAPRGMVIGGRVLDPRLNFPPKNTKVISNKQQRDASLPVDLWPTSILANSTIWDEGNRAGLRRPHFKKKDIDSRKSKLLVPGSKLKPLRQDDRVPILLIQRSIEAQSESGSPSATSTRELHGWTLIVPKGWGMSFFSSLTHTGTRVGGQREIETQYFEAGCLHFPHDYPCTTGYQGFINEREMKEKERWERKPPAKRPSWEKLDTKSPWQPDWETVLGLETAKANDDDLIITQRDTKENVIEDSAFRTSPWLLRGQEVPTVVEFMSHSPQPAGDLLFKVNEWRSKRSIPVLSIPPNILLETALVAVRLSIPRSGSPEDNAIIYKMSDDEARKWRPLLEHDKCEFSESEMSELKSSPDSCVGYVTSGNYSLSIGRGQAVGAVSLSRFLELKEQLHRVGRATRLPMVKIRNKDSTICRAAYLELIC